MKDRYLINIYKIIDVKEQKEGGLDDISEQTGDQLDEQRDFQFQLQGDSFFDIVSQMNKRI